MLWEINKIIYFLYIYIYLYIILTIDIYYRVHIYDYINIEVRKIFYNIILSGEGGLHIFMGKYNNFQCVYKIRVCVCV